MKDSNLKGKTVCWNPFLRIPPQPNVTNESLLYLPILLQGIVLCHNRLGYTCFKLLRLLKLFDGSLVGLQALYLGIQ
jgi:hypothetical protein